MSAAIAARFLMERYVLQRPWFEALEPRRLLAADPVAVFFTDVTAAHGLDQHPGGSGEFHAGGAVFTDLTNDGYADLYLPAGTVFTGGRVNELWVNVDDGSGGRTFERVSNDGGAAGPNGGSRFTTGAIAADYDNDGDLDLYVTEFQADNILYKNMWVEDEAANGAANLSPTDLRFVDVTASTDPTPTDPAGDIQHGLGYATFQNPDPFFGNDRLDGTMAAAWADVNRDGWIDLYVGSWDGTNGDPGTARDGQLGERDTLYLNNGDGTFTDATMGTNPVAPVGPLLDDGSFEAALSGSTISNSNWSLTANTPATTGTEAVAFFQAPWASTSGGTGVWFRAFAGRPGEAANGTLTQTVTATEDGGYTLTFDARVESSFDANSMRVTIASSGTGGSETVELMLEAPNDGQWRNYNATLTGVTAGDSLTVMAEMVDASVLAGGPNQSALIDNFVLTPPGGNSGGGWEPVTGWAYPDGSFNDPSVPAEFSGLNAVQFADFNNDGWQDLIVATMGGGGVGPNRDILYVNRGNDESGEWLGYHLASWELGFGGNDSSEMGVTVADVDNDGDLDYFATDGSTTHSLWLNQFADTGVLSFVETFVPAVFSWGANYHDFDNNGRVDLLIGTQAQRPLILHLQDTDGVLHEVAVPAGLSGTDLARAVLVADYNRDGFSDVLIFNISNDTGRPIELYENLSAGFFAGLHYLNITLEGDPTLPGDLKSTRDAVGAVVHVTGDFDGDGTVAADETRMEQVVSGHSQATSSSSLALEIGTGKATEVDLRIVWASGREHVIEDVATDQFLVYNEGALATPALAGDFNNSGQVEQGDLDLVLQNWGRDTDTQGVPAGWTGDPADGLIEQSELDRVLQNWGNTATPPLETVATSAATTTTAEQNTSTTPALAHAQRESRQHHPARGRMPERIGRTATIRTILDHAEEEESENNLLNAPRQRSVLYSNLRLRGRG